MLEISNSFSRERKEEEEEGGGRGYERLMLQETYK
jgi:hypothetical protein